MSSSEQDKTNSNSKIFSSIISGILLVVGAWYFFGGGVEAEVANDEIEQYEMCMRNNDYIGASVHAGVASAAYLEAGDEENYKKWNDLSEAAMAKATSEDMEDYSY